MSRARAFYLAQSAALLLDVPLLPLSVFFSFLSDLLSALPLEESLSFLADSL